jgi:hypothetical protein
MSIDCWAKLKCTCYLTTHTVLVIFPVFVGIFVVMQLMILTHLLHIHIACMFKKLWITVQYLQMLRYKTCSTNWADKKFNPKAKFGIFWWLPIGEAWISSAWLKKKNPDLLSHMNIVMKNLVTQTLLKAMLHGAIFLATCNAILLLRNVN